MTSAAPLGDDPLRLWRAVTDLSVRALPEPGPAGPAHTVKDYLPGHHLPWELVAGHISTVRQRAWRHAVFAGLLPHGTLQEAVARSLGTADEDAAPSEDARRSTAVLALVVSESGKVEPESLELSRAWWLAARLADGVPVAEALEGFEDEQWAWRDEALEVLASRRVRLRGRRYPRLPGDVEQDHQPDHADLAALLETTRRRLDPARRLPAAPGAALRIASRLVETAARPAGAPAAPLLNHPVAAALDAAQGLTRFRQAAGGLLGVDAPEDREDVLDSREALYYAVAPRQVPWGTSSTEPPSLASQFAVDAALHRLEEADGIWTAPPSTAAGAPGPEVSDAISSALLTRRGVALAEIPDLAEIFDPEALEHRGPGPRRAVHPLHPDLHGTEYLHLVAPQAPAEGAGPFGVRVVLAPGMNRFAPFTGLATGSEIGAVAALDAVLNILPGRRPELSEQDYREWEAEAEALLAARDRASAELDRRQRYHEAVPLLMRSRALTEDIRANIDDAAHSVRALQEQLDRLEDAQRTVRYRWNAVNDEIAAHLGEEPGFWRRAASAGRVRIPWREKLGQLRAEQSAALAEVEAQQERIEDARRRLRRARENQETLLGEYADAEAGTETLAEELRAYPYEDHLVDAAWLRGAAAEGIPCPWLDPEVQWARREVYDRALRLHALTVRGLAEEFRAGLLTARDLLSGRAGAAPEAAHTAWQVLCMVFPEIRVDPLRFPELGAALGGRRLGWALLGRADRLDPAVAYAGLVHVRRGILVLADDGAAESPFLSPAPGLQERLARATSCSPDWAPAAASAWTLGRRVSRYRPADAPGREEGPEHLVGVPSAGRPSEGAA